MGDHTGSESTHDTKSKVLLLISTSATKSNLQHSSHSSSHSNSRPNSCSSTPDSQTHHTHAEHMRSIDAHLATPHCVAALCRETIDATHRDAAHDGSAVTLVNIIKLQNQVIERQNTWHILDQQVHTHLKTQLVNRDLPQECRGTVLKQGYGALDAEALDALEAEAAEKKVEEEKKKSKSKSSRKGRRNNTEKMRLQQPKS